MNRASAQVGDSVEFTLTATNRGNLPATDVVVEDTLPSFLSLEGVTASSGTVTVNGATVTVTIGTLAPGETVTIRISARVNSTAAAPANINTGTLRTSSDTDDPTNNNSSVAIDTSAAPTAVVPIGLPNTSAPADGAPWLLALGLALIMLSLGLRPRRRL